MLVTGGKDGKGHRIAETYYFDTVQGNWEDGPNLKTARSQHGCTTTSNGLVLVAGGYTASGFDFRNDLASVEMLKPQGTSWIEGNKQTQSFKMIHFCID